MTRDEFAVLVMGYRSCDDPYAQQPIFGKLLAEYDLHESRSKELIASKAEVERLTAQLAEAKAGLERIKSVKLDDWAAVRMALIATATMLKMDATP
jgi:hypothetical protein